LPILREAVADLSWLRTRGYAEPSAIKLVGDRYQLRRRQRVAVGRCACSDQRKEDRAKRRTEPERVEGKSLVIDGLNVITTLEVALGGGVLLIGRDQCMRDMASFHGSYRMVRETERALAILVEVVESMRPRSAIAYIDRPVSNSGRLAGALRNAARAYGSDLQAQTADRVDEMLKSAQAVTATADSAVLDACGPWLNLARTAVDRLGDEVAPMWLLDLS
jgi:hypothetical protein